MSMKARWSHAQILSAVETVGPVAAGQARLELVDLALPVGIGRDHQGDVVFVVPPGENVSPYEGRAASFLPLTSVQTEGSGAVAVTVGVLRFRADELPDEILSAIASAIYGCVEVIERGNRLQGARAAAGLARLIDQGMLRRPSRAIIEGIMGELLVMLRAADSEQLFSSWHEDPDAPFDFSTESSRLEVKSTGSAERQHEFSSGQVSDYALPTDFASVLLQIVESGATLETLTTQVAERLRESSRGDLWSRVETLVGLPIQVIDQPQLDIDGSLASIQLWPSEQVPQPTSAPGVRWMRWSAALTGAPPRREQPTDLAAAFEGH